MKLLFIENRYKTYLFDAIAKELQKEHQIFWIVQNPEFSPTVGEVNVIKFPENDINEDEVKSNLEIDFEGVIQSDRQQNYFKKKGVNYFYYYAKQIDEIITQIQPDFVFGESTAFHELLTIEICKKSNILYLTPSSCRYPVGRFSFYKYNTLEPYKGSGELLGNEDAINIIESIENRVLKPDYMKKITVSKSKIVGNKLKIIKSYYGGEKYNTPSPLVKYKLEQQKNKNIEAWEEIAIKGIEKDKFSVLYPMQMQPEANIDVWGRKCRDQFTTIVNIHKQMGEDEVLYIKPNPKSKYELTNDLITYISKHKNIVALQHTVSMDAIFKDVDLFITVTGTIAIECILANKPIVTLVKTINNTSNNCLFAESFNAISKYKGMIKKNIFPKNTKQEKINYLNRLNMSSFKGSDADPFSKKEAVSDENIALMMEAFNKVFL